MGVRHLFAALDLGRNVMCGHVKKRKKRAEFSSSAATCAVSNTDNPRLRKIVGRAKWPEEALVVVRHADVGPIHG